MPAREMWSMLPLQFWTFLPPLQKGRPVWELERWTQDPKAAPSPQSPMEGRGPDLRSSAHWDARVSQQSLSPEMPAPWGNRRLLSAGPCSCSAVANGGLSLQETRWQGEAFMKPDLGLRVDGAPGSSC